MRIALVPDNESANAAYRSIGPMTALASRGHELRRLSAQDAKTWVDALQWCEVLHIHRLCDDGIVNLAQAAKMNGAAVVWDDDDDMTRPPKGIGGTPAQQKRDGSLRAAIRTKLFKLVDLVTTPSPALANVFRAAGAREVRVIENFVIDHCVNDRLPRERLRIGWVGCDEHRLDVQKMQITGVLDALLDAHPQLTVTTIGIRLGLRSDRYTHVRGVPLGELLKHVSSFGVGIAPLSADVAMNHNRSNVKVKEYAAVGVPWLASPIGPYSNLGDKQGGRLVPDERWHDELDALIGNERVHRKLAKKAARWGRTQLVGRNASHWEDALAHAVERSQVTA